MAVYKEAVAQLRAARSAFHRVPISVVPAGVQGLVAKHTERADLLTKDQPHVTFVRQFIKDNRTDGTERWVSPTCWEFKCRLDEGSYGWDITITMRDFYNFDTLVAKVITEVRIAAFNRADP